MASAATRVLDRANLTMQGEALPRAAAYEAIEYFTEAARFNHDDPYRCGNILLFDDYGQVVMTGDLHGNIRNFRKLLRYAALENTAPRHIILHELLHVPTLAAGEEDPSFWLMVEAAKVKCEFPDQVHFLLGNHEIAQLTNREILKEGFYPVATLRKTVLQTYGEDRGQEVLLALNEFILSMPLAAKTPNRIFMSHSLPDAAVAKSFDFNILERPWNIEDAQPGGAVYAMVWGRQHPPEYLESLAARLDVQIFIIGHIPQESGYRMVNERLLILASEHSHGVFLPFDMRKPYTMQDLVHNIRKIASIP